MPVMSGYDLVKQMKVSDLKYIPPVIILSSDLNNTIIDEYKEMGIDYVFSKPVNLSNFKVAVDNSLKKAVFN
jgi:CheY-like chemotaxis protein